MGRWIDGKLTCVIEFSNVYVEDGENELEAIFPDGWEGEMTSDNLEIDNENEEE